VRSLYVRILVVLLATVLLSLVAFLAVFFSMTQPHLIALLDRLHTMQADEAMAVFERAGPGETREYLQRLDRAWGMTQTLTDANGRDVVNGDDRTAMLAAARAMPGRPATFGDGMVIAHPTADRRFYLLSFGRPPLTIRDLLPYYALILGAIALLCWLLALDLVRPLRQTALVVKRFGSGDLAARTGTRRRDEIGDLGRAIDQMADRTQTLLTAERRLLQDISHELRSPLTRLRLAIELVPETTDPVAAADRLRKEADRLTALVTSLIEVTRAEGDPTSRRSAEIDLARLIRDIIDSCALEISARDLTIDAQVVDPLTIHGDEELLRRTFENVLRNAIRHAPTQTAITVAGAERDGCAVVSIRDRGPGVPASDLPRLGEPFFRVDESRDAASGGVGLGLSIARRAIHLHHGTLLAENANPGLRLTITIPL
jgi:two-component system sensor histidine kinase CpxA